jgi:hypothetical protein
MFIQFIIIILLILTYNIISMLYHIIYKDEKIMIENKEKKVMLEKKNGVEGIFEIHITVKNDYVKLITFIRDYPSSMKIIYAVAINGNNQYMISKFTRENSIQNAMNTTNKISIDMKNYGIQVIRKKIKWHYGEITGYHSFFLYFEYHVKISSKTLNINKLDFYLDKIRKELKKKEKKEINKLNYSYNLMSRNYMNPILTIRTTIPNHSYYKDLILNTLKNNGFKFEDKIQQEVCVYDNNIDLDKHWLI